MAISGPRRRRVAGAAALPLVLALAVSGCDQGGNESTVSLTGTAPPTPQGSGVPQAPSTAPTPSDDPSAGRGDGGRKEKAPKVLETIASGLAAPWGLDFFPDGDAIVTERDTQRVLRISSGRRHQVSVLGVLDAAAPEGEGGLLGVAVSPDFESDRTIYLYLTTGEDNRVVRTQVVNGGLTPLEVVLDGIPNGFIHDGGRLEFGPDGLLYVSTGESGTPALAQDRDSLGGKILRITTDGEPAPDNPSDSPIWTLGHRNVQGLAFDERGNLWASEFGQDAFDELNKITAGANYGWPEVEGTGGPDAPRRFTDPQQTWDVAEASPSGLAYADGFLWMAALRGERLWRVKLKGGRAVNQTPYFVGDYGRMRTIARAPDGTLWLTTSNRDGRGDPAEEDDRILRVRP
ncbi:PQQ-dependent sugar dehydrogenase [Nocardioides sp.]|uniref:PQQ-dependent sugar dehydrogenase n=1 Tax=Nocardioides sp. TaxID=35761 RepID=UPI00238A0648|nr:PQQ-dependent sugar dehydrogenase [Nocardioides sp.]MDE0777691.1 PQQ-dependent sugar dehydrogenase [Nocardioides sp.]